MKLCVPTELKVLKYCARKFVVFGESRNSDIYCGMDQWQIEHISVWFLKTFYFTVFRQKFFFLKTYSILAQYFEWLHLQEDIT